MQRINEAEIRNTWAPIIEEATGISDSNKLAWMSEYCHNHKLYEDANIMSLSNNPGPMNLTGMGAVTFPGAANTANVGGSGTNGSGDKAPTLLPLAMQVAAQTIGLDLVPVVPMAGPMGLLSYLDFTYEGGTVGLQNNTASEAPTYIKVAAATATADIDADTDHAGYTHEAASRIDGKQIFKVEGAIVQATVALDLAFALGTAEAPAPDADEAAIAAQAEDNAAAADALEVELVKALDDHIPGFSGKANGDPYSREEGERTADRLMGMSLFSKSVAAETFQVAAAVTREQVQDLKQFGVDVVA
jgi:hypothetical protein